MYNDPLNNVGPFYTNGGKLNHIHKINTFDSKEKVQLKVSCDFRLNFVEYQDIF